MTVALALVVLAAAIMIGSGLAIVISLIALGWTLADEFTQWRWRRRNPVLNPAPVRERRHG